MMTRPVADTGRSALITGITGQDGAYLTALLCAKGYRVHGLVRPSATDLAMRLVRLRALGLTPGDRLILHTGDVADPAALAGLIDTVRPDEIYHLAALSHVADSFAVPMATARTNVLGVTALLEAVRRSGGRYDDGRPIRVYQAATSELYGPDATAPQAETTAFRPRSPYGATKLYAYWLAVTYREAYGLYIANGILFNHESPLRGDTFVSRHIAKAVAALATGRSAPLMIGNLDAERDWGHARDYVEGMWRMLQQDRPDDYVLATGRTHSVRHFVERCFARIGRPVAWQGCGLAERGLDAATGTVMVRVDPARVRPLDIARLCGDAAKARRQLGWQPRTGVDELIAELIDAELAAGSAVEEPVLRGHA